MFDCGEHEAQQLVMQKQGLEMSLTWDLYEVFSNEFLPTLRSICEQSILEVIRNFSNNSKFISDFQSEWTRYACMRGLKKWNGYKLLGYAKSWSPFECGDWIRVYGEIVEKGYFGEGVNADRLDPQKGTAGTWGKVQIKGDQHDRLIDTHGHKSTDSHRRRIQGGALTDQSLMGYSSMFGGQLLNRKGQLKEEKRGMTMTPARDLATSMDHSGILNWAILDNDLTGKIDQVFGLMRGATISGTTTDNIFFLKRFYKVVNDNIFFLLPIATIGAGGHHSLIEIALPLTLNGYCNYSVGCYATLFPAGYKTNPLTAGGAQAIKNILQAYDHRGVSCLILCYYETRKLAGCYVAEQSEMAKWLYKFKTGTNLLKEFETFRPFPNKAQIQKFATDHGFTIRH